MTQTQAQKATIEINVYGMRPRLAAHLFRVVAVEASGDWGWVCYSFGDGSQFWSDGVVASTTPPERDCDD